MTNREIDRLVAEKVMGWIKPPATSVLKPMWVEPPKGTVHPELPHFSSDLSDAWLVVNKLGGQGIKCNIITQPDLTSVELRTIEGFQYVGGGTAPTAPKAICLAALKMKGVSVDG